MGAAGWFYWFPSISRLVNSEHLMKAYSTADLNMYSSMGLISWSGHGGLSWSERAAMEGVFSVQPRMHVMQSSAVVLVGGRPGL